MNVEALFSIRNLHFSYEQKEVLKIERLDLMANQVTLLVGSNGSGKTTLLKLINGLLKSGSGQIDFRGEAISGKGYKSMRSHSVLVHQDPFLFSGSVFQNVAYGLKIRKEAAPVIRRKVNEKLTLLGLTGFEHRKVHKLSGGEKQRVAIARALVLEPEVLLLDEPAANVDNKSLKLIEALILQLQDRGVTVILSAHNRSFAYRLGSELLTLKRGRIIPGRVNIFKGFVKKQDEIFTYFISGKNLLRCPAQKGDFNTAVLPLNDVILSEKQINSSAQNNFRGKVTHIKREDRLCRIELACPLSIQAHITEYSLNNLQVKIGKEFYLAFKASAVKLY